MLWGKNKFWSIFVSLSQTVSRLFISVWKNVLLPHLKQNNCLTCDDLETNMVVLTRLDCTYLWLCTLSVDDNHIGLLIKFFHIASPMWPGKAVWEARLSNTSMLTQLILKFYVIDNMCMTRHAKYSFKQRAFHLL